MPGRTRKQDQPASQDVSMDDAPPAAEPELPDNEAEDEDQQEEEEEVIEGQRVQIVGKPHLGARRRFV